MQALTLCDAKVVSTRTAVGQFKGKFKGEFKMQAHRKLCYSSGVVMDVAAFKVSHSVVSDIDATALPAARARSVSIGA